MRTRLLAAAFLLLPAACGLEDLSSQDAPGPDAGLAAPDAGRTPKPDVVPEEYDMHRLLEDEQILGGQGITVEEVQEFLALKGSYLAGYTDPLSGQDAATIIVERSRAYGVSPLYMLARIQTESSLVTSGTAANLDKATGCGCPDGGGCNPELGGFGNQIECAAEKMRAYHDEIEASGVTRAGWQVGVMKMTSDPCMVTPANRATAMLYTYTPWVGAYGEQCGTPMWGGSSLVALAYYRYWLDYDWNL